MNLFKNTKMDTNIGYCPARIIQYMKDIRLVAEKNGVYDEVYDDNQKRKINIFLSGLVPKILKTSMESKQMKQKNLTKNWDEFFAILKEETIRINDFIILENSIDDCPKIVQHIKKSNGNKLKMGKTKRFENKKNSMGADDNQNSKQNASVNKNKPYKPNPTRPGKAEQI